MLYAGKMFSDLQGFSRAVSARCSNMGFPRRISASKLQSGDPATLLPILHYSLLNFSSHVAEAVKLDPYADVDDATFTEAVFRTAIQVASMRPALNARQFLSAGFVEKKLTFVIEILDWCERYHSECEAAVKRSTVKSVRSYTTGYSTGHYMDPVSASTRSFLHVQSREEQEPLPNSILPPQASQTPTVPRSAALYSEGRPVSAVGPGPADVAKFLSDAVSLGEGAQASLISRRVAAGTGAGVAMTAALATAMDPALCTSAGWKERVQREIDGVRAARAGAGVAVTAPPLRAHATAALSSTGSRLPVHKQRLPGGVLSPERKAGSPQRPATALPVKEEEPVAPARETLGTGHGAQGAEAASVMAAAATAFAAQLDSTSALLAERLAELEIRLKRAEATGRQVRDERREGPGLPTAPSAVSAAVLAGAQRPPARPVVPSNLYSYLPASAVRELSSPANTRGEVTTRTWGRVQTGAAPAHEGNEQATLEEYESARQRMIERRRAGTSMDDDGGSPDGLGAFLAGLTARAAGTEATIARNAAVLRASA